MVTFAVASKGAPSLNQTIVGTGIPDAEHVNTTVSVMFTVVSMGALSISTSSGRKKEILNL